MSILRKANALKKPTTMRMNITSMMDMFTIILVFLLYSYSIEDQDLNLEPHLRLPDSNSTTPYREAVKVSLTKRSIKVNQKVVVQLRNGRVSRRDIDGLKILPLYDVLLEEKKELEKNPVKKKSMKDTLVLLQADRNVDFKQIDPVMKTAGMAGFPNFRFAVMRTE